MISEIEFVYLRNFLLYIKNIINNLIVFFEIVLICFNFDFLYYLYFN